MSFERRSVLNRICPFRWCELLHGAEQAQYPPSKAGFEFLGMPNVKPSLRGAGILSNERNESLGCFFGNTFCGWFFLISLLKFLTFPPSHS